MIHDIHPKLFNYFGISGVVLARWLIIVSIVIFSYALLRRFQLLRLGLPQPCLNSLNNRFKGLITDGFLQRRQPRYLAGGILHMFIFWGFLILSLRSLQLLGEAVSVGSDFVILAGVPGIIYNRLKDIVELTTLTACILAIYRRAIIKPDRFKDSHQFEAYLVLGLVSLLMITDLLFDGSGISLGLVESSALPISSLISFPLSSMPKQTLQFLHNTTYWLHLICFLFLLNLLPLSKHFHIITALPNVFFRKQVRGELKPVQWDKPDLDHVEKAGVEKISDFTWKNILDFYSCTECGRCTDNCPANAVGRNLSPKKITMALRDLAYKQIPIFGSPTGTQYLEDTITPEELWNCTTCGSCEEQCPVFIEHVDKIIDMRRYRVMMKSDFPPELTEMFRNLEGYGDPWGNGMARRKEWAEGISIKDVAEVDTVDIVYWVGCSGAFDSRHSEIARAFARLMDKAEVNAGTLGKLERCCGDFARRTGNEYLFQTLAQKNIRILNEFGVKKIVVSCPHGYNTLKNEYPRFGGNFEVIHHSRFLWELIEAGCLKFSKPVQKKITYHDSCYLGRYNGEYDAPRKILESVPGVQLVELDRNREKGFCCGAGGGYMWLAEMGQRINETRARQIISAKPELIATACPFCLTMLTEGIEAGEESDQIPEVMDLTEIIEKGL